VRALPAPAHRRGVPWHRHGTGHREEDRRVQRRHRAGRVDPGRGRHVRGHVAGGRRGMTQLQRLLVVEDSESDIELLREALADSDPAVELDVVDLNLPRMGGFEVLRALREDVDPRLRRLPVVVFTTSATSTDVDRAYD